MSKKVYVKVDKEIESGDLVRCVEYDGYAPGEVRKVEQVSRDYFSLFGCWAPHEKSFWQPVHKLQVGDQVICHRPGVEKKPWTVNNIESQGRHPVRLEQDDPVQFINANACELELWQPQCQAV